MKSRQFNVLLRNETEKGISDIACHFSFASERVFFASPFDTSSFCGITLPHDVSVDDLRDYFEQFGAVELID